MQLLSSGTWWKNCRMLAAGRGWSLRFIIRWLIGISPEMALPLIMRMPSRRNTMRSVCTKWKRSWRITVRFLKFGLTWGLWAGNRVKSCMTLWVVCNRSVWWVGVWEMTGVTLPWWRIMLIRITRLECLGRHRPRFSTRHGVIALGRNGGVWIKRLMRSYVV